MLQRKLQEFFKTSTQMSYERFGDNSVDLELRFWIDDPPMVLEISRVMFYWQYGTFSKKMKLRYPFLKGIFTKRLIRPNY